MTQPTEPFQIIDATVDGIHSAFKSGQLTRRQPVQMYIDRIERFDKSGPAINSVITVSPTALAEADRMDADEKASRTMGALHGLSVILKDQIDAVGVPTTLGSVLFKNFYPSKAAF